MAGTATGDVVHCLGKAHLNVDSLSRLPCRQCGQSNHKSADSSSAVKVAVTEVQIPGPHTGETLHQLQLADPVLGPLLCIKEADTKPDTGSFPSVTKSVRRLLQIWDQLEVHAGILCRCLCPIGYFPKVKQAVIPDSLRNSMRELLEGTWESKRHWGACENAITGQGTTMTFEIGVKTVRPVPQGNNNKQRQATKNCKLCL